MKATGVVRRIDPLGRIVIPREILKTKNIKLGDAMEFFVDGNDVVIRKHEVGCYCCGTVTKESKEIFGREICPKCYEEFKNQMNLIDQYMEFKNDSRR